MWLYIHTYIHTILYIPSLHDELAHPRILIGRHANIDNVGMLVPMLVAQLFQYRICIDLTIFSVLFGVFSVLLGVFSVSFRCFSVLFGSFWLFSVLFGVYSYRITSFVSIAMLGNEIVVGVTFLRKGGKHMTCCL